MIVQTPVPQSYDARHSSRCLDVPQVRHTGRFLAVWLLSLPLSLVTDSGWLIILIAARTKTWPRTSSIRHRCKSHTITITICYILAYCIQLNMLKDSLDLKYVHRIPYAVQIYYDIY